MPGIDFQRLRTEIAMRDVLELLGFIACNGSRDQRYGPCPIDGATSEKRDRRFSVNLKTGRFFCRECGRFGDQLDLWAAATKQPLHAAAVDLCSRLHREPPWIHLTHQSGTAGKEQQEKRPRYVDQRRRR